MIITIWLIFAINRFLSTRISFHFAFAGRQYGVETRHHEIDFTETQEDVYERVSTVLDELDVGILVNNVGMQGDDTAYFLDIPNTAKRIKDTINVNVYAQVKVRLCTYLFRFRAICCKMGHFTCNCRTALQSNDTNACSVGSLKAERFAKSSDVGAILEQINKVKTIKIIEKHHIFQRQWVPFSSCSGAPVCRICIPNKVKSILK